MEIRDFFLFKVLFSISMSALLSAQSSANPSTKSRKQYRSRVLKKASKGRAPKGAGKSLDTQRLDSFYDPEFDYSTFTGRVTDRDETTNVLKISSENRNTRFFRSGDKVRFRLASKKTNLCTSHIRSVEKGYFVIYVNDLDPCSKDLEYFRRGTMLVFKAERLAVRVRDAALFRLILLRRKKAFYSQLNDINHFVWTYDQQKVKTAAEYDRKIVELKKEKSRAIENLISKKSDGLKLQKELAFRLDQVDGDLDFYRIEKDNLVIDRWHLDHDLGVPVGRRPSKIKFREF